MALLLLFVVSPLWHRQQFQPVASRGFRERPASAVAPAGRQPHRRHRGRRAGPDGPAGGALAQRQPIGQRPRQSALDVSLVTALGGQSNYGPTGCRFHRSPTIGSASFGAQRYCLDRDGDLPSTDEVSPSTSSHLFRSLTDDKKTFHP